MQTTQRFNQTRPFNEGILVNRIFTHTINGKKESASKLRDSIDSNSQVDRYSGVAKNALEKELKNLAARSPNERQVRESIEKPFADDYKSTDDGNNVSPTIKGKKKSSMNKRAVNYHTRDLNQYPFFNYSKRR